MGKMFRLKNREFTFTVDDSQIDCGLNGALYFVAMDQDGGAKRYGNAGAKYGTGYCDAQCPHDLKWINNEANVEDWVPSETDENAGTGKYGTCCTDVEKDLADATVKFSDIKYGHIGSTVQINPSKFEFVVCNAISCVQMFCV